MQSLGRVGRILSGSLEPGALSISREQPQQAQQQQQQSPLKESPTDNAEMPSSSNLQHFDSHSQSSNYSLTISRNPTILQEPDVIASTKLSHSKTTDSVSLKLYIIIMTLNIFLNYRLRQLVPHNNQLHHLVVNVTRTVKFHRHQNISQLL